MRNLRGFLKCALIFHFLSALVGIGNGQSGELSLEQRYFDLYTSSPYEPVPSVPRGNISTVAYSANNTSELDDGLSRISQRIPKNGFFGSFNPEHIRAVIDLVEILTGEQRIPFTTDFPDELDVDNLEEIGKFLKSNPNVHPRAWYRAFSIVELMTMPDMVQRDKPSSIELFPTLFFPTAVLEENATTKGECVLVDERIGLDNGIENRLWYYRENVLLNAHHWNWHLRHPTSVNVTVDRRGESFYFIHHDLLARYTAERLANDLKPTEPLNMQLDVILEEGYNPHLKDGTSNRPFAERKPFSKLLESLNTAQQDRLVGLVRERDRVIDAINQEGILHRGGFLEINDNDRINILGDLTEASAQSINREYYGMAGFHATGHALMSRVDAPEGAIGVITDLGATMRDPMFYRWHQYIDLLFQSYKLTLLKPHTPHGGAYPLVFEGIQINSAKVVQEVESDEEVLVPVNHLETFWNIHKFDLADGIDVNQNSTSPVVNVCTKHLDHHNFYYEFEIENFLKRTTLVTIRMFMAPRYKTSKSKTRFSMAEQRSLFFTMDSFQTTLKPGKNEIARRSIDSSLTADWPKSINEIRQQMRTGKVSRSVCQCGFPQHLLLPRGRENGMVFDLFVMVTDGLEDIVRDNSTKPRSSPFTNKCPPSHIHCGLPGKKYPDSKPMGYPFDRKPYSFSKKIKDYSGKVKVIEEEVPDLDAYVQNIPNMHASQVIIQHHNEIRAKYYEAVDPYKPIRLKKF